MADITAQPQTVTGATAGKQTINMIDPNYKYPQVLRGNLAFDRTLGFWGLIGTAEYVWSKTQHDVLWKDLNWQPTGAVRPDGRLVLAKFDNNINDAVLLTNTNQGDTQTLAFKVEKPYRHGFYASGAYLWNRARSISDGGAFVALSSWRDQYRELRPEQSDAGDRELPGRQRREAVHVNRRPDDLQTAQRVLGVLRRADGPAGTRSCSTVTPTATRRRSTTSRSCRRARTR